MGQGLITWYSKKWKKTEKLAFFFTFIFGLLVHMFTFTNTNFIGDSIARDYTPQDMTGSGRWFLQLACSISSYYDLPWLNGIMSVLYISITAIIIVRLFKMENPVVIALSSALLVSFPAVTSTFFYNFTADGYMLAMLLSALSVYFIRFGENRISRLTAGGIALCLSCAIYQAYVSFALVLTVFIFIKEMMEKDTQTKYLFKWLGSRIAVLVLSIGSYWAIWKVIVKVKNVEVTEYQGISDIGKFSVSSITTSLIKTVKTLVKFVFDWDPLEFGIDAVAVLKIVALAACAFALIAAIIKSGLFKKKSQLALCIFGICCLPFFICLWQLTSWSLNYHILMLQSICLIFIFALVLAEKYLPIKPKNIIALIMASLTFYFVVEANISYFNLDKTYERTHATASAIAVRVNSLTNENVKKVAYVGYRKEIIFSDATKNEFRFCYIGAHRMRDHISHNTKAVDFLNMYYQVPLETVTEEECYEILDTPQVEAMGEWPAGDSVKVISDTVVVKLGHENIFEFSLKEETQRR